MSAVLKKIPKENVHILDKPNVPRSTWFLNT